MSYRFLSISLATVLLGGCTGLAGDFTTGAHGRTQWQIQDGLCPGLGGGCALDVRVAVGAGTHLYVKGVDAHGDTVTTSSEVSAGTPVPGGDASAPTVTIPVQTLTPGDANVALVDATGAEVDHVTMHVAAPTSLACGIATGSVDWRMGSLSVVSDVAVPVTTGSTSTDVQVACRAADAAGAMLSVDAIHWTVTSGSTFLTLQDDFSGAATEARGARIYFHGVAVGVALVHVTLGTLSYDLTVHVG